MILTKLYRMSTCYNRSDKLGQTKSMPGTKTSGRPGGNPDFGKKFKAERRGDEALDKLLAVKITASMHEYLQSLKDKKADFIRDAIAAAMKGEEPQTKQTQTVTIGQDA